MVETEDRRKELLVELMKLETKAKDDLVVPKPQYSLNTTKKVLEVEFHNDKKLFTLREWDNQTLWDKIQLWKNINSKAGFIFYLDRGIELKIFVVDNFFDAFPIHSQQEEFILKSKMGIYKKKPFFLVKDGIPISLDLETNKNELVYDSESFYNIMEYAITSKLTKEKSGNIIEWLKKNKIIIIVIIIAGLLFFTPQGKEFLNQFTQYIGVKV